MAAFSILKIIGKGENKKQVWKRILRRFLILFFLNIVHVAGKGDISVESIFYAAVLIEIAWASLIAMLLSLYIKNGNIRFYIGMAVFTLQFVLDLTFTLENTLMTAMGDIGVVITATAFSAWMFKADGRINEENFKKRLLPVTFGTFVVMYLVSFVQWAKHPRTTVPLAMMAIGVSGIAIFLFYSMEKTGYKLKLLIPFGKNLLMMFLIEMVLIELIYMEFFLYDYVLINPWLDMIIAGVIPLMILFGIAKFLEKKKIFWHA